ncbi:uroporphyrinogen-III synthase [Lewinella marina]|uniref:Uroporphyrinogen-III synthase n=1 Tax=Neolewinella marina TaxID=438751 RepID=A0A2G0CET0_9BACT|nr:uroporphyrinogen-III synthase [Neolewinella marina]NJB87244.1 uroporphyrinogen-III synthase [Neolewinella marina]PHK98430.1 uroporphyrinogen-III synthase [Neolewinella marina]
MAADCQSSQESYKPIRTILVSQPEPERSPFAKLEEKYGLQIDWRPFIEVKGLSEKEFRKERIRPDEYTAVIFTSKLAIEHFFRLCKALRIEMSQETKYYCMTEAIANYLQKFIVYRKRKVFYGQRTIQDLAPTLKKHRSKEKFLLPTGNLGSEFVSEYLEQNNFDWTPALMYRTVAADLSDLEDVYYDVIIFYSPLGIDSLYENFPDFKQKDTRLAVAGRKTTAAVERAGLTVNIAPNPPEVPSMGMALENYLKKSNKQQ